jgi:glycosyltransferase involved in cell wall biosynthesis
VKIAILHSRYRSGSLSGENRVVDDEIRLLREAGHEVIQWTPAPPEDPGPLDLAALGVSAIWSSRSTDQLAQLLHRDDIDVVHVHNLFPNLSPAVLRRASGDGVAVVLTLHNYRLLCLPATLLRKGRPCQDCVGRVPWPGVLHRCYRSSRLGSAALATSLTLHREIGTFERPSLYLAVSEFVRQMHIRAGFRASQIRVKPNFAWPAPRRAGPGEYFLYLGRLSQEKGVVGLVRAWQGQRSQLLVVGDGPESDRVRAAAHSDVTFMGQVSPRRALELARGARALILPSIGHDAAPRSIQEAYASGVPVIGSRTGGITEAIRDGQSGFLVPPSDPEALRAAVGELEDDEVCERLGEGAYALWLERYTPTHGLNDLEQAYRAAEAAASAA